METTQAEMYAYENYTSRDVRLWKLHKQRCTFMKTTQAEMYAYENCTQRCTLIKTTQAQMYAYENYTQRCTFMKTTHTDVLMKTTQAEMYAYEVRWPSWIFELLSSQRVQSIARGFQMNFNCVCYYTKECLFLFFTAPCRRPLQCHRQPGPQPNHLIGCRD